MPAPVLSIITPCYNEAHNAERCVDGVRRVLEGILGSRAYEHILADNASTDETVNILRKLAAEDPSVRVILNARNFGPARSAFNALLAARGDAVLVLLPADLQDPPELIPEFLRKWEQGYRVVCGIRKNREEGLPMRAVRKMYYRLVRRLAYVDLPVGAGDFQLVDRTVIQTLRTFEDGYPYVRGMIASCGFRTAYVEYTWRARKHGKSKNRMYDLVDQGINGIISFSNVPCRIALACGFLLSVASVLYALVTFIGGLFHVLFGDKPVAPAGIPTLIVALFFFSGVQLFFLGVLGEYICAIHRQVRKRPLVVESERINFDADETDRP